MTTDYVFRTGSDNGRIQVDTLAAMLDPTTTRALAECGAVSGRRCLELGAGGGSISRWLANRVGPNGTVDAVDVDTSHLVEAPGLTVHTMDLNDGLPDGGPYDLIHARMLMMHLRRRREVFDALVAKLAPGGWLVLCDATGLPPTAVAARHDADRDLFDRVLEAGTTRVGPAVGMDLQWAHAAGDHMHRAGLTNVREEEFRFTSPGGSDGMLYYRSLVQQLEPLLTTFGFTEEELWRLENVLLDPVFAAWSYQFVITVGRRPPTPCTESSRARDR
ncbi:class I SAM-dependent methyltransferase [Gordonia metallireducens]|uniref:class I SAM-dependent methyltransferase n=1 Tax=Gordonia metallireducens TaxID=2897779 RepID=UPI001E33D4FA|nr:class I SAM-dependent methyltransferase [Gordonia metallireducens]